MLLNLSIRLQEGTSTAQRRTIAISCRSPASRRTLSRMVSPGACDFYHFTDNVDETGLKFDYLLKPGIATTRNAIALLKYLGYPMEITEKASDKDLRSDKAQG